MRFLPRLFDQLDHRCIPIVHYDFFSLRKLYSSGPQSPLGASSLSTKSARSYVHVPNLRAQVGSNAPYPVKSMQRSFKHNIMYVSMLYKTEGPVQDEMLPLFPSHEV
jgi:hypothetical protein